MNKKYMIDEKPVTWEELIKEAKGLGYDPGEIITTSGAAGYLRTRGFSVKNNPNYQEK